MLRASGGLTIERINRRALRDALFFLLAGVVSAALIAGPAAGRADAIFRAFSPTSPWNETAAATSSTNPYAGQFTDHPNLPLRLSGTPDTVTYSAPIFFAQPGDPKAPVTVTQRDWLPHGPTEWNGKPIPVPIGVQPAPGADGHLTIVSADRKTAWDFLGCTEAGPMGYVGRVIVQWNLNGPGYSTEDETTSARGSGAPLVSSSLRADEALNGIRHALGLTVPRVSADYDWPATHSDGEQGGNAIKYGMRFVLRPDYPVAADAPVGVVNLVYALKTYGAYLVDQGADFELDADFTRPDLWQLAGLNSKSFDIRPSDMRPAELGTPPPIPMVLPPATQSSLPPTVRLRANRRPIRVGSRLHVYGRVLGQPAGYEHAHVQIFIRDAWHSLFATRVKPNGRFAARAHLRLRRGNPRLRLKLRHLRVRPGRLLHLRAKVSGFGQSNVIRVRLRHP
jgi:hypothetical protein